MTWAHQHRGILLRMAMAVFRRSLSLYPAGYRARFGGDMERVLESQLDALSANGRHSAAARHWLLALLEIAPSSRRLRRSRPGIFERSLRLFDTLRRASLSIVANPGYAALILVTVGIGVATVTTAYTLVDAAVLRALPYPDDDRIAFLWATLDHGQETTMVSADEARAWRSMSASLERLELTRLFGMSLSGGGVTRMAEVNFVSPGYLELLGARTEGGHLFAASDRERSADQQVAIVSHDLARELGDPAIEVGSIIEIEGRALIVVGVMDEAFRDLYSPRSVDVWLPAENISLVFPDREADRGKLFLALGRLAPAATIEQATRELNARRGSPALGMLSGPDRTEIEVEPLRHALTGHLESRLWALLAGATGLLALAIFNMASLVLVRGLAVHREVAVCRALGAPPAQASSRFVAEVVLLSAGGAVLGGLAATAIIRLVVASGALALPEFMSVYTSVRVAGIAAASAIAAGLIASLSPAIRLTRVDLSAVLSSAVGRSRVVAGSGPWRQALVVGQVAVAVLVVAGAGLLERSAGELRAVDLGFRTAGVVVAQIQLPRSTHGPDAVAHAAESLQRELAVIPGVEFATIWGPQVPLVGGPQVMLSPADHRAGGEPAPARYHLVSPGALGEMEVSLLRGRDLGAGDTSGSTPAIVVSESLANALWPGSDALGKRLQRAAPPMDPAGSIEYTVVGVAADVLFAGRSPQPGFPVHTRDVYFPLAQHFEHSRRGEIVTLLGTEHPPADFVALLGDAVRRAAIDTPLHRVRSMSWYLEREEKLPGVAARLMGAFGVLSLALAALGIYGVLSQVIAQREREIGLRRALGASRRRIACRIGAQATALAATGLAAGLVLAIWVLPLLRNSLFGVAASDPLVIAGVCLIVVGAGAIAALAPVWRAMRIDPASVLRDA